MAQAAARRTREREARIRARVEGACRTVFRVFAPTNRRELVCLIDVMLQATDRALAGDAQAADDLRQVTAFLQARNVRKSA
jgi:hypothetical protein